MKKFLLSFLCVLSFVCIATLTGCDKEGNKPVIEEFTVTFNTQGGSTVAASVITSGEFVSEPAAPTKSGYVFSGWFTNSECSDDMVFVFTTPITADITLYAKWVSEEVLVSVVEIEIITQPTKTVYIEGETFNSEGMVVEAILSDGSREIITNYTYMTNFELTMGLSKFPINYGNLEVYVTIEVVEKMITKVEVKTMPEKTVYFSYESFEPSGLVLSVTYTNGKTASISEGYTYSRNQLSGLPTSVVVNYNGVDVLVPITVTKVVAYAVASEKPRVDVDARAIYNQLELTVGAGVLNKTTVFGTDEEITIVASADRSMGYEKVDDRAQGGTTTGVTYQYLGYTYEGLIKFMGASSHQGRYIVVKPTEDGVIHFWGSLPSGSEIADSIFIYDNYTETTTIDEAKRVIKLDGTVRAYEFPVYAGETYYITAVGTNTFLRGMALVYNPTYHEVEEFNINATNVTKDFAVGQTFNYAGLTATVVLKNGETYTLTSDEFVVEMPDLTTDGLKTVTVKYDGVLVKTYEITVHPLTGIEITVAPDKLDYFATQDLDLTGMVVSVFTEGGIKYQITNYSISKTTALALDDIIVVSFGEFSVELEITIVENSINSIEIKTMPDKLDYKVGEIFDSTGLIITVKYKDGNSEDITTNISFDKSVLSEGDTIVKATYDIFTVDILVTVRVVDYVYDTRYINTTEIVVKAGGNLETVAANISNFNFKIGDLLFNSSSTAFQYERITTTYTYDGYTYTGVLKAGGATQAGRYIQIIPSKDMVLTLYAAVGSGVNSNIFIVNSLVAPLAGDPESYVAKVDLDSNYIAHQFNLTEGETYYLWFMVQTYIRGMKVDYGDAKTEVLELELDYSQTQLQFSVNDIFNHDNLVVKAKCADGETYTITDYTVSSPDMAMAGPQTITVKYGKVTVATYEITLTPEIVEGFHIQGYNLISTYSEEEGTLSMDVAKKTEGVSVIRSVDIANALGVENTTTTGNNGKILAGSTIPSLTIGELTFYGHSNGLQVVSTSTIHSTGAYAPFAQYNLQGQLNLGGASSTSNRYIKIDIEASAIFTFFAATVGTPVFDPTIYIYTDSDKKTLVDEYIYKYVSGTPTPSDVAGKITHSEIATRYEIELVAGTYYLHCGHNTAFRGGFILEYGDVATPPTESLLYVVTLSNMDFENISTINFVLTLDSGSDVNISVSTVYKSVLAEGLCKNAVDGTYYAVLTITDLYKAETAGVASYNLGVKLAVDIGGNLQETVLDSRTVYTFPKEL